MAGVCRLQPLQTLFIIVLRDGTEIESIVERHDPAAPPGIGERKFQRVRRGQTEYNMQLIVHGMFPERIQPSSEKAGCCEKPSLHELAEAGDRADHGIHRAVARLFAGELVSAPVNCFNAHFLATTSTEWLHTAWIVGRTLESLLANSGHVVGDLFLMNRLLALVDAGILEWQDNGKDIRRCKVRLRSE